MVTDLQANFNPTPQINYSGKPDTVFRYFLSYYFVNFQKVRIFATTTKTDNYIAYEKTSINNRFERLRHNGYGSIPPLSECLPQCRRTC